MDLRQLRYFVAIVEQGSLSRAAQTLRVAQPALSQHLRNMEEELGVVLLHRGSRGALPTPAGTRLLALARTIIAEFATMRDVVRGEDDLPSGTVHLGLSGTVSELLGVPLIEAVRSRYPGIQLRVREAMSGFVLDWLRKGDLDLAVVYGVADPRGLTVRPVLTEDLCLIGAPALRGVLAGEGEEIPLRRAAALPLMLPSPAQGLRAVIDAAATQADLVLSPEIEVDSYAQLKLLAVRGLGFGILPEANVQQPVASGVLTRWRLVDPPIRREVCLAHPAERPLSAAARAVVETAWETMRRLVREGIWAAVLAGEA
ncbi:LysR family transcriptional regulator [Methylobacterium sp. JK268]